MKIYMGIFVTKQLGEGAVPEDVFRTDLVKNLSNCKILAQFIARLD
jgi:hypothetical protein